VFLGPAGTGQVTGGQQDQGEKENRVFISGQNLISGLKKTIQPDLRTAFFKLVTDLVSGNFSLIFTEIDRTNE